MLDEKEKRGVEDLLSLISDDEVIGLSQTITNKLIHIGTRQEALNAISMYASCGSDVLHRQKIRKELLFNYLNSHTIAVDPSSNKGVLIEIILSFWQNPASARRAFPHGSQESVSSTSLQCDRPTDHVQQLGLAFATWFYNLLNSVNVPSTSSEQFGPNHFWPDCILTIVEKNAEGHVMESQYHSAAETHQQLDQLIKQQQLFFNPNFSTGLKTTMDVHGLVAVFVAGTLQRGTTCIGMFEQTFGLIKDGSVSNTWKIKWTKVMLMQNQQNALENSTMKRLCN